MKLRYTRILSLLLCAALACSILAGYLADPDKYLEADGYAD